jgi:hypothetical protein
MARYNLVSEAVPDPLSTAVLLTFVRVDARFGKLMAVDATKNQSGRISLASDLQIFSRGAGFDQISQP